jgi:hypothetical protein
LGKAMQQHAAWKLSREWWDTHLAAFAIPPSFQQHTRNPHEY